MSKNEKVLLFLLAAINFTHILDFMIMMPLGNYLMPFFKITPQEFTMLVAAYTLSAGLSGFVAAFFVDGYDRKKILLVGYIGFLAGTVACGFAPSYGLLLGARVLAGVFGGLIGAQVLSIVSDVFAYERRGAAMGAVMSSFSIASTFGVPFALYLANIFSWHAPFLLVGFLGIVLIPLIIKYVPVMDEHILEKAEGANKFEVLKTVWQNPAQRLALLFSGLIMMGHFLIVPFINPYLEFNNGYSKTQTPMVYLVGVIVITMLPPISFSIVLVLFALWFILATGRGVTAQALVSNVVDQQKRGSFMSFNSSMQQLGTAAASLIAGFIVISGSGGQIYRYNWLGYLSVAILIICALLGYRIFKSSEQVAPTYESKSVEVAGDL
jgi:predicted MFS family arabinose efflux permease